jgi:hypothetical protein
MTDRRPAWITHAICLGVLAVPVAGLAYAAVRADRGIQLGAAIATIGCVLAGFYAIGVTVAVSLWARRPRSVLAIHLGGLVALAVLVCATCVRR